MRSVLYCFPDLAQFELLALGASEQDFELSVPSGESVEDGEWILAIFELGNNRRATSVAARAIVSPDGMHLLFEPRDWQRLLSFAQTDARHANLSPRAVPKENQQPSGKGARILVVDDDETIRSIVSLMLEDVGLVVSSAASAEEALPRIRSESFSLLVLDWNLPKLSGIDLCRLVRGESAISEIPVLFLTANASSQDMVEAFASGADDYVVKPFRAPELGARIFSLLRRRAIGIGNRE